MILSFLNQIFGWVFVHASFKHDSHASISKFQDFYKFSKLGFMCSWEFGDFVQLDEIE